MNGHDLIARGGRVARVAGMGQRRAGWRPWSLYIIAGMRALAGGPQYGAPVSDRANLREEANDDALGRLP